MENDSKKKDIFLSVSILVAGIMISGSLIYLVGSNNKTDNNGENELASVSELNQEKIFEIAENDVVLGDPKAPVTILEYGDYQCPWCSKFALEVEPSIRSEYIESGKVKMIYRNFAFLGPESFVAAEAAECAKDQGKFWAYHDEIYKLEHQDGAENNGNLTSAFFLKIAKSLGLDEKSFTECVTAKKYASKVQQDLDGGGVIGVNGTPAVFINNKQIGGFLTFDQLKIQLDSFVATE